ncbi:MAG: hypothetical protein ABI016_15015 [Chthoniobacterales bacterium]
MDRGDAAVGEDDEVAVAVNLIGLDEPRLARPLTRARFPVWGAPKHPYEPELNFLSMSEAMFPSLLARD